MNRWRNITTGLIPLVGGAICLLLSIGECQAQSPRAAEATNVRGSVVRMTTAPRGEIDGAVLDDGTWLHWPPHLEGRFANLVQTGDHVSATGRTEMGPRGDTHFEVQTVTNLANNSTVENVDFAIGPPPGPRGRGRRVPPPPRAVQDFRLTTVRGVAQRFTTAPMGEVDGVLLDNGTWLHWPPHLEGRFADVFQTGDTLEAVGRTETVPRGEVHFEVQSVTNVRNGAKATNPDLVGGPAFGPAEFRRAAPDMPATREQRLHDLQDQIDRLQRELEWLRAEK